MKKELVVVFHLICILSCNSKAQPVTGSRGEPFSFRVVARDLTDPWEISYGPDHFLWVTESREYRVSRIDPVSGDKQVILDLSGEKDFVEKYDQLSDRLNGGKTWPEGGLMGMALHPRLLTGKPYVYLAYLYRFLRAEDNFSGCYFNTKIVRYTYDPSRKKLVDPLILCDTIPGSNDHNGGRLLIAPVQGKDFLFYSLGDMGAGQFINGNRPNHAQDPDRYEGKILRFNTEPDGDRGTYDQWIPNDNPFSTKRQSAVWTIGHRNPEGLAYGVVGGVGRIYSSEHGPFSDDEVNIIEKGKNYGHPLVIGYADNNYNGLSAGASNERSIPGPWHSSYPLIGSETDNARAIGPDYRDPIKAFYPGTNEFLKKLLGNIKIWGWSDWPAEAPSSIDVYTSDAIPGWKNSLLIPTLKGNKLIRLQLNAAGDQVASDTIDYFSGVGRLRDIALSPDGLKIYLSVDNTPGSSQPSQHFPGRGKYRGCILEFTYLGRSDTVIEQKP